MADYNVLDTCNAVKHGVIYFFDELLKHKGVNERRKNEPKQSHSSNVNFGFPDTLKSL